VPDRSDPEGEVAYGNKIDANNAAIRAMGEFYIGLAEFERIDLDAWNDGQTDQDWVQPAIEAWERSRNYFRIAAEECSAFQEWFPEERKGEIDPDIEYFNRSYERIGDLIRTLENRELPTLRLVHSISNDMQEAQTVGQRKARALRGTPGHYPRGHP
jgi:hypothetical protein